MPHEPVPNTVAGEAECLVSPLTWLDISPFGVTMVDQARQMPLVPHLLETLFSQSRAGLAKQPLEMPRLEPRSGRSHAPSPGRCDCSTP